MSKNDVVKSALALGTVSHAIGTARAYQLYPEIKTYLFSPVCCEPLINLSFVCLV